MPKTKYDVKAAAQQTSVESKLAILEREVDRDDATHEDILELRQRMSDVERSLDGNLSEAYTNWMESADEATAAGIKEDFQRVLNDCND